MITTRFLMSEPGAILAFVDGVVQRFVPFQLTHLIALVATGLIAGVAVYAVRARPQLERELRTWIGTLILVSGFGYVLVELWSGTSWRFVAPLHLCDLVVAIGAIALFKRHQQAFELLYFWGLTGTLLALVTPELAEDFPHHRYFFYFLQHGSIVVGAVFLAAGLGMRPQRRAVIRAWLWLNGVGLCIGIFDFLTDANFLFLRRKPGASTPLDAFGPWPWYVVVCDLIAIGMFALLTIPFIARREPR
jgi:hypothetical integral membrane protein (TIGR02206 family)